MVPGSRWERNRTGGQVHLARRIGGTLAEGVGRPARMPAVAYGNPDGGPRVAGQCALTARLPRRGPATR